MIGLGTIINCGSVLAGASAGMLLKNGLSKRFEDTIMQGIGLCTMFIGIGGALSGLLTLENGQLATQHTMLLILSLALAHRRGAQHRKASRGLRRFLPEQAEKPR